MEMLEEEDRLLDTTTKEEYKERKGIMESTMYLSNLWKSKKLSRLRKLSSIQMAYYHVAGLKQTKYFSIFIPLNG